MSHSHYDRDVPGQFTPPRPQPPRKRKMPLLGKLALIIGGTFMLLIGGCTALVAGSGVAETVSKTAADPAPVISTQTPTAIRPASTDERFVVLAKQKYPELSAMSDDTIVGLAKSACKVLEAGEQWQTVIETIGEAAKGSEALVTGLIRVGVNIYCPQYNERVTPGVKKPSKPTMTTSQEQAVGAAQDYLRVSAFSRAALIDQLTSEYGSGFTKKDATFAVDYLKLDWNAQAVKAAKAYLAVSHFSRKGLIEQLESEYGGQFTHAQAVYGATKAGL